MADPMNPRSSSVLTLLLGALLGLATASTSSIAQNEIDIDRFGAGTRAIPVTLTGFTGEVESTLRFDLEVMGFIVVPQDRAQFLISGSNADNVAGRVTDKINHAQLLGQDYRGAAPRILAHWFADDIAEKLTGRKGIARTRIAFKIDFGRTSEIYVADYDGYNSRALTADHSIVAAPAWGPGRKLLCYTSYQLNNPDIFSHNLQTGERKVVARYSGLNASPSVSPDGRRIAMVLSKDGSPDIYVADIDGSNLRRLTRTREDESSPCWAPDGRTICFVSRAPGKAALYKISVDGGEMRRISTAGVGGNLTEPDWSPDGKTIVFTAQTGGGFDICTVPAEGGQATVLVSGEDPSWASNSRTVIFTRRSTGRRILSLLDVPTKRVKDIPRLSGNCSQPSWAR